MRVLIAFAVAVVLFGTVANADGEWGAGLNWRNLKDGLAEAKQANKPAMVLIHKSWCGACKSLRSKINSNPDLLKHYADNYVLINVSDDDEPTEQHWKPDGAYIPRLFFVEANGRVRDDLYNIEGNKSYKYFYTDAAQIAKAMQRNLPELLAGTGGDSTTPSDASKPVHDDL